MSDTETNVKIGANTGELNAGMAGAEATVDKTAAAIQSSMARMSSQVSHSMDSMHANIKGAFSGIETAMTKMNGMFGMVAGALAGGAAFKAVISETVNWTGEAVKLSKQLGITVQEASLYNTALGNVFLSTETLTTAAGMLTRNLKNKEEAFTALGVATRDQNGHYRSTMEIMNDVNAKLSSLKEGTDRNTAGMSVYGRAWLEVMGILKLNTKVMEEARQELTDYNKEVNPEKQAEVKKYKEAMENVGDAFEGVKLVLGNALLPALTQLGEFLGSIGPAVCTVMSGAVRGLLTFFEALALGGVVALNLLAAALNSVLLSLFNLSSALMKLATGDFKGALDTLKNGGEQIKRQWVDAFTTIETYGLGTGKRIKEMWGFGEAAKIPTAKPEAAGRFDGGGDTGKEKAGAAGKDATEKSRLAEWRSELEQIREAEGEFFKESLSEDLAYWEGKLNLTRKGSEEERQVRHEIYQIKARMAREEYAESMALEADQLKRKELTLDHERELALIGIGIERDKLNQKKALQQIDEAQYTAELRRLAAAEHAIDLNALQQKLFLARQGSIEEQQLMNQIETSELKHSQRMGQINTQAAQSTVSPWRGAATGIATAMGQAFGAVMTGTQKLSKTMANMAKGIVTTMAQAGSKMLSDWVTEQFTMTAVEQEQQAARTGLAETAEAARSDITAASAGSQITANAGVAAAGGAASQAGIPFVGPALAAAASAAMMALVMGMMSMASAAGGYDIPSGVNPITQLHQDEMVLPADLANSVRSMTGKGGNSGGDTHIHNWNVQAWDSKDMKKFINRNGAKFADNMVQQVRNFKVRP